MENEFNNLLERYLKEKFIGEVYRDKVYRFLFENLKKDIKGNNFRIIIKSIAELTGKVECLGLLHEFRDNFLEEIALDESDFKIYNEIINNNIELLNRSIKAKIVKVDINKELLRREQDIRAMLRAIDDFNVDNFNNKLYNGKLCEKKKKR